MIDTVVLTLNYPDFKITKPENFDPNANLVHGYKGAYIKAIYDPRYKSHHGYMPKLTFSKRMVEGGWLTFLRVEFSAPALLFGNNLQEVDETDFEAVLKALQKKLLQMGVEISTDHLAAAAVSKIHYGKNFLFRDYSTAFGFIDEIRLANVDKRFDANQADYRNEGHSLSYRTNSQEIIFYDKMLDIAKAKRSSLKSVEPAPMVYGDLINRVLKQRDGQSPMEVLRMEIRLNDRKKIKAEILKHDLDIKPTFKELFSKDISQFVCLHYLNEIKKDLIVVQIDKGQSKISWFDSLQQSNPNVDTRVLLEYLGFITLVDASDFRTARRMVERGKSNGWQTFKKKLETIHVPNTIRKIDRLVKQIEEFKILTALDF